MTLKAIAMANAVRCLTVPVVLSATGCSVPGWLASFAAAVEQEEAQ